MDIGQGPNWGCSAKEKKTVLKPAHNGISKDSQCLSLSPFQASSCFHIQYELHVLNPCGTDTLQRYQAVKILTFLSLLLFHFFNFSSCRSRNSDWLRAGRPRGRSSSPGRVKNCPFSSSSRPALGPTQPPIRWVPGVNRPRREADHSPPTSAQVTLCIHSPIRLHGVVLN
jgi:hypothetical protein